MTESLIRLTSLFQKLPGIGPKSASRLAYHILTMPKSYSHELAKSLEDVALKVRNCNRCYNYCEGDICNICLDDSRKKEVLCVIEHPKNISAIENTGFKGLYHVLGGVISPLEGIGPDELRIGELFNRIRDEKYNEIIFALNPRVEADTTVDYIVSVISKKFPDLKLSRPASGIPVGSDMEYADAMTLYQAFSNRIII